MAATSTAPSPGETDVTDAAELLPAGALVVLSASSRSEKPWGSDNKLWGCDNGDDDDDGGDNGDERGGGGGGVVRRMQSRMRPCRTGSAASLRSGSDAETMSAPMPFDIMRPCVGM